MFTWRGEMLVSMLDSLISTDHDPPPPVKGAYNHIKKTCIPSKCIYCIQEFSQNLMKDELRIRTQKQQTKEHIVE